MATELLSLPRAAVAGIPLAVAPLEVVTTAVLEASRAPARGIGVHFANAYTLALADADPSYAELLSRPGAVCFTDGMPVAWFGRRQHPDLANDWERVYGPDVMAAVLERSGPRHYLLGGKPEVLASLREQIAQRWPDAEVVGAESPPFRELTAQELHEQDARIADSGATIVWVGLGTPKQDWEVARLAGELPVVAMAVGAAFDFISGAKSQAPRWMRRSGLEWVHRLGTEPRRLARRYFWGNPRFVRAAITKRPR